MMISIRRTGGFAGVREQLGSIDTTSWSAAQLAEVEGQLRDCRFAELPRELPGDQGADLFRIEVTVTRDANVQSVAVVTDGQHRHQLSNLVDFVLQASRR